MSLFARWAIVVALLTIAAVCGYLAIAAREAPRDTWWALWFIEGLMGGAAVAGAWLLWPQRQRC